MSRKVSNKINKCTSKYAAVSIMAGAFMIICSGIVAVKLYRKESDDTDDSKEDLKKSGSSRHFLNTYSDCINDAIDGVFAVSTPDTTTITRIFTTDKAIKVVLRSDFDGDKEVALISGGGSGHEPAHSGFVGKGMLTAAVCGEIFASPPTKAIVNAIKSVGGTFGALLIVKNYTGDVLNFRLAASIAKEKYDINTEIIIIDDDCAIGKDKAGLVGRRGIAGTVFVHKIAGYLAQNGYKLNDIKTYLEKNILPNMGSIGIAATSCYLPGSGMIKEERIKTNELELGLGIHGESGAMTIKFDKIINLIPQMFNILYDTNSDRNYIDFLSKKGRYNNDEHDVVVMVNNLGGSTPIEMGIIMKFVLKYINGDKTYNLNVKRIYCGAYMTSLDMRGFSITLLKVNNEILKALDFAVTPISWIPGNIVDKKQLNKLLNNNNIDNGIGNDIGYNDDEKTIIHQDIDVILTKNGAHILRKFVENACIAIENKRDYLNKLDSKVGDGDTGSTLVFGTKLLKDKINKLNFNSLYQTLRDIGEILADMGGSSGALYGYLFISASKRIKQECGGYNNNINGLTISNALLQSVNDLSTYSGAKQGDRTMIDALYPAVIQLNNYYKNNNNDDDLYKALTLTANKGNEGAQSTKIMKPKFGRSCYVPWGILKNIPDPGAVAVSVWIQSLTKK